MEFCDNCSNMLYICNDEENNLVKYCKHCILLKKKLKINVLK